MDGTLNVKTKDMAEAAIVMPKTLTMIDSGELQCEYEDALK